MATTVTSVINIISVVISMIFLLIILSYYAILFIKVKKQKNNSQDISKSSISIIIPAHNEEKHLAECVSSVINADWSGFKEIIVIDDGSVDKTFKIAESFTELSNKSNKYRQLNAKIHIKIIRTKHSGKSASLNLGIKNSKSELIAIVDGDSIIDKFALKHLSIELSQPQVAAATGVVKVKNRNTMGMWLHIEQLYASLMRSVFSKVNANITTPGPLSMYKREALVSIGLFSTEGFSEDADVAIRLIRKGHKVVFSDNSVVHTYMPDDLKGIIRQRSRFARGTINLLKRHLRANKLIIDLYTLPLLLFFYVQSIIMGSINLYQIFSGYSLYFISKGIYFNFNVFKFFFEWFSLIGFIKWSASVILGLAPLTFLSAIVILTSLLSYPLYLYAVLKYDKKIDFHHIIPIIFMFPFWIFVMLIYLISIPEIFSKNQYNKWKKNE